MQTLQISISSFSDLRAMGHLYVDKTKYIHNLLAFKEKYVFLSRPRRFGKSLLVSTFAELFSDNKELFSGLWIEKSDYQWHEYPIIQLDFSRGSNTALETFKENVSSQLADTALQYGYKLDTNTDISIQLSQLIKYLARAYNQQVVVLIDEYDSPLLRNITNTQTADEIRISMGSFFATLKSLTSYLHFVFITGVSKFSKVSLFSGMNNLFDISLHPAMQTLLGYTQDELEHWFAPYLHAWAKKDNCKLADLIARLRTWYNGYLFADEGPRVYSPFSLHQALRYQKFSNYWFSSATPSFLVAFLQKNIQQALELSDLEIPARSLDRFDIGSMPVKTILLQSGYLTFKRFHEKTGIYELDYPNQEVQESFKVSLLEALTDNPEADLFVSRFAGALERNDLPTFFKNLTALFAKISYNLVREYESFFHVVTMVACEVSNLEVEVEVDTLHGRMDMVCHTQDHIFIFEFKFMGRAPVALAQIKDRDYFRRYTAGTKAITLVGVNFIHKNNKIIIEWEAEDVPCSTRLHK